MVTSKFEERSCKCHLERDHSHLIFLCSVSCSLREDSLFSTLPHPSYEQTNADEEEVDVDDVESADVVGWDLTKYITYDTLHRAAFRL